MLSSRLLSGRPPVLLGASSVAGTSGMGAPGGSRLIVTFCNVWPAGFSRAMLDTGTGCFYWIDMPGLGQNGTDGICSTMDGGFLTLEQVYGGSTLVSQFDNAGRAVDHRPVPEVLDGHDLVQTSEGLAIADTGHDRVILLNPSGDIRLLWAPNDGLRDTEHINSLAICRGRIFASAFGPRPDDGWRNARAGYIVDCGSGEKLVTGIAHPHSLRSHGRHLWWCESATSRVYRVDRRNPTEVTLYAQLFGYLRGLAISQTQVIVAASARRQKSKHLGHTIPVPTEAHPVDDPVLFIIDRWTRRVRTLALGALGAEVFALASPPKRMPQPSLRRTLSAVADRVAAAAAVSLPNDAP